MALEDEIINIEDLEISSEVKIGDFVLLETTNGTRLLDFKDFIIGLDNITFFDRISGTYLQTSDISAVSAKAETNHTILTELSSISADVNNNTTRINDMFNSLTTFIDSISTSTIDSSDISSLTNSSIGFTVSNSTPVLLVNTSGTLLFNKFDFQGSGLVDGTDVQLGDNSTNNATNSFFYKAKGDYGMLFSGTINVILSTLSRRRSAQQFLTLNKNGIPFYTLNIGQGESYNISTFVNLKKDDKITIHFSGRNDRLGDATFSGIKIL